MTSSFIVLPRITATRSAAFVGNHLPLPWLLSAMCRNPLTRRVPPRTLLLHRPLALFPSAWTPLDSPKDPVGIPVAFGYFLNRHSSRINPDVNTDPRHAKDDRFIRVRCWLIAAAPLSFTEAFRRHARYPQGLSMRFSPLSLSCCSMEVLGLTLDRSEVTSRDRSMRTTYLFYSRMRGDGWREHGHEL